MNVVFDEIEIGQVWKSNARRDYGDIIRWQVVACGINCFVVRNCATSQDETILRGEQFAVFIRMRKLRQAESPRWPEWLEEAPERHKSIGRDGYGIRVGECVV